MLDPDVTAALTAVITEEARDGLGVFSPSAIHHALLGAGVERM
ncbi:hypothetical protein [Rhodococcus gordoniae]|nr:hypothetical protein [Rhodococcus gordoniae]